MTEAALKKAFSQHIEGAVGGRLFPGKLPAGVDLPAARYTIIDGPPTGRTHDEEAPGQIVIRMQVTTWHRNYNALQETAEAICTAAEGFQPDGVHHTYRADFNDAEDPDTGWAQSNQDFLIHMYRTQEEST